MAAGPFVKIDRFLMKLGLPFSDQSSIWAHDLFSPHCDIVAHTATRAPQP